MPEYHRNIETRIVADSINPNGKRLTSAIFRYPRFIHAELMTHRVFSRNSASSRAIPTRKMIEAVEDNPATFEFWGKNQPGMQAVEEMEPEQTYVALGVIQDMRDCCVNGVRSLEMMGVHKQISNRYLEAFGHITVLVTSCEWENFFSLRVHKDAQPEFQVLATRMAHAWLQSEPQSLQWGEWHIPQFVGSSADKIDPSVKLGDVQTMLKIATARCARLSYLTFDGEHSPEKDIQLHDSLLKAGHLSPFEHCAQAVESWSYPWSNFDTPIPLGTAGIAGLSHWKQYRKCFKEERQMITREELQARIDNRPAWVTL